MAQVLQRLNVRTGTIVHGQDSLDEVSITGKSLICRTDGSDMETYELYPEDVGLKRARPEEIQGGDARENAGIVRSLLDGADGPRRDIVLLSASMALVTAGRAPSLEVGLEMAKDAIDSGEARRKLEAIVRLTNERGYSRMPLYHAYQEMP
jgi:anthranilate phosphoribosyltransferase